MLCRVIVAEVESRLFCIKQMLTYIVIWNSDVQDHGGTLWTGVLPYTWRASEVLSVAVPYHFTCLRCFMWTIYSLRMLLLHDVRHIKLHISCIIVKSVLYVIILCVYHLMMIPQGSKHVGVFLIFNVLM